MIKWVSFGLLSVLALVTTRAEEAVDRNDPKFVTASVLIAEPGRDLCAYLGHACIRLECPHYKLDYCYSYECEGILAHPWRFLAGDLKMGMFATPTEAYLAAYRVERRGVRQFMLDLPPSVKQRLWQVLDRRVQEGINIPYDPLGKSCAVSVLRVIAEACRPGRLGLSRWPFKPDATMREIVRDHSVGYDWHRVFLCALFGTAFDREADPFDKVIVPSDLLGVLCGATLDGKPILAERSVALLPPGPRHEASALTPMMLAVSLLVSGIATVFVRVRVVDAVFMAILAVCGLFVTFLLVGSMLPLNPWNWLIVPFNPLPLVLWKWRRYWLLPYVVILVIWSAAMLLAPHQLTDWSYVVLVFGYIAWYLGVLKRTFRGTSLKPKQV